MFNISEENLARQVLDRLSKLDTLPIDGFLCGGAVANTILSIIDNKEYPINDLDIFYVDKDSKFSNTPVRFNGVDITGDRYENRIIIPSTAKSSYRISSTSNEGLINYVYVTFSFADEGLSKEHYKTILKSFDINCCKAGIDLFSGELYLDDDFKNFIQTRQLECVNPVTPMHSAIRIVKKQRDLGAYLNKDEVFKFLSQFFHYDSKVIHSRTNITMFFGKKYREMFLEYQDELKDYFELWTYAKTRKYFTKLNNEEYILQSSLKWFNEMHMFQVNPDLMDKWYEIKLWSLYPKKYTSLDGEIKKYYIPSFGTDPTIIKILWNLIYKQNKKQKNKSLRLLSIKELYPFVIANEDFHNCDFNEINVEKLIKFINENPSFCKLISACKLNFQESEKLMGMIKKLFPTELELFCDLISKEIWDEKYFKPNFNSKIILDQEYLSNKFSVVKQILSKKLINELDLSDFEYKDIIKELISPLDLLWGGKYMHNCLKGYEENGFDRRIEKENIRVFIISDDKERSALQISKSYSNTYRIDQLYGHSNTQVCLKHKMIADYLIQYLEYKHYLLESQKIINNFISNKSKSIEEINKSTYEKSVDKFKSFIEGDLMPMPIERAFEDRIQPLIGTVPTYVDEPTFLGATIHQIDERDLDYYQDDEYEDDIL